MCLNKHLGLLNGWESRQPGSSWSHVREQGVFISAEITWAHLGSPLRWRGGPFMSLSLFPPSGWESQAARPSVPQEEQGGHAVPDSHTHHFCWGGGWSAQWNMGRHPNKGLKLNTGIANNTHSDVLALKEPAFHTGFVVTFQKKCNKSTIFTPLPHPPPQGSAQSGVFCRETVSHGLRISSDPALQELSESPSDRSSRGGLSGCSSLLAAPLPARYGGISGQNQSWTVSWKLPEGDVFPAAAWLCCLIFRKVRGAVLFLL